MNSFIDFNRTPTTLGILTQAAHKIKVTMHVKQVFLRECQNLKTRAFILYPMSPMSSSHSEQLLTRMAKKLFQKNQPSLLKEFVSSNDC